MTILLNIFLLSWLCVFITDYSGAVESMLTPILRKLTGSKVGHVGKPWTCSLCQTWWLGLIYLLIAGQFTLVNVALVALVAALTPVTYLLICLARDVLETVIGWIYELLGV